jgi:hypothetical protein
MLLVESNKTIYDRIVVIRYCHTTVGMRNVVGHNVHMVIINITFQLGLCCITLALLIRAHTSAGHDLPHYKP